MKNEIVLEVEIFDSFDSYQMSRETNSSVGITSTESPLQSQSSMTVLMCTV